MCAKLDMVEEGWPNVSGSGTDEAERRGSRWRRIGSGALGGVLLSAGLRRRSRIGAAAALVGGWLAYRAVGGRRRLGRAVGRGAGNDRVTVERTVTVGEPAEELSERLRDPAALGAVVGHFAGVTAAGEDRQRWTVAGPADRDLSWETRLVEDDPGERLRWETVEGRGLFEEWASEFRPSPGGRGTQVTFRVSFAPPGGSLGRAAVERLETAPETLVGDALGRFKSLAETGEVPSLEGNPSARGRGDLA
jgi:uncharacterized membrane protein